VQGPDPRIAELAEVYSKEATGYLESYSPHLVPMQQHLVTLVDLRGARHVLDLGCGPGTALPFLRQAPGALVVAADRAYGMLRLVAPDVPRVNLDAMALPFRDDVFDAVTMAFVVFHLPSPSAGLAEVARVLHAGGQLALATWGPDERLGSAWAVWNEELDRVGAPRGPQPGLSDYLALGSRATLGLHLGGAGFTDVRFHAGTWHFRPEHRAFLEFMTRHAMSHRLDTLDEQSRRSCLWAVVRRTKDLPPEELGLDSDVLYVVATR
jgi:demethylmenaquinone methyltransferase/2-methoxy-6-polyprenyl-1,4-benzoquinol methylase